LRSPSKKKEPSKLPKGGKISQGDPYEEVKKKD
jgi:predicted RNase H-like nuclease (RuvC/YqgF family)